MDAPQSRGAGPSLVMLAILGFVPAMAALLGVVMLAAGILQLPKAKADLAAFRADASCAAGMTPGRAGACQVRDAVAIMVRPSQTNSRNTASRDNLEARFPDGSRIWAQFDGPQGVQFTRQVYPDDPIRVQTFRGRPVLVEGRGIVAKTTVSPDLVEPGDRIMAWSGAAVLAVLGLIGFVIFRRLRLVA